MDLVPAWLRTDGSVVWTVQRVALAAVALPFGPQSGVAASAPLSTAVAATGFAMLLALGLATRVAALGIAVLALASLATGHGLVVELLALALSIGLAMRGGGALSLDDLIVRQLDTLPLEQETTPDGGIVGRRVGEYGT